MSLGQLPVLYSFRRCPYAMRARLAIACSGQACELREVVLRDKPPSLLLASAKATVPVLVLPSGQVIEQSLEIMLWALRQHDPQAWLAPAHESLDSMLDLIHACDREFKLDLDRTKYPQRFANAGPADAHRARAMAWLDGQLVPRLQAHDFLSGPSPALADMALVPFVRQFVQIDASWFEAHADPALQQWLTRCLALPLFEPVMRKFPVWVEGSVGTVFSAAA